MATYAFSDLHSQYNLWKQIKEYIKPTDTVYCLGDCVDRGDAGLKILQEVIAAPNITLLRGNHEDFILQIGQKIIDFAIENDYDLTKDWEVVWNCPSVNLWFSNSGYRTIEDFCKLSIEEQTKLVKTIKELPTHITIENENSDEIFLCHAGTSPKRPHTINCKNPLKGRIIDIDSYIWDRDHLLETKWSGKDNEYCVHGHTPVKYMHYLLPPEVKYPSTRFEIFKYCEGHKINIDLGSMDTHCTCLFNLDTFEPIYFKDKEYFNEN